MTDLSPQAQAVLDAMHRSYDHEPTRRALAAGVLRAAADQVVPDQGGVWTRNLRGDQWTRWEERKLIRAELLAIAAELEGN